MGELSYTVQRPGSGSAVLNAYRALVGSTSFHQLTGVIAFASEKGARLLCDAFASEVPTWRTVAKRWAISIDGGITEPDALRYLLSIRNTEVRVPDAQELLTRRLQPIVRFHPKTLLLEQASPQRATAIAVGSANLTGNGLCFGHEHLLTAKLSTASAAKQLAQGIDDLLQVYSSATIVDDNFIDQYEALRPATPTLPEEFEHVRTTAILQPNAVLPSVESAALAAASNLWVDIEYVVANRGNTQEGNQIDLRRGTRVFFGFDDSPLPRNSAIGTVRIRYGTHSADRNLRFGNNHMDKLDLPIPGQEGPATYQNTTLLFTRQADGSYVMQVGTPADVKSWKAASSDQSTLFAMRSGREYGVF